MEPIAQISRVIVDIPKAKGWVATLVIARLQTTPIAPAIETDSSFAYSTQSEIKAR
jgi:hypothetical protein